MKAYAHPTGEPLNEYGLLELNEISLSADSETVRAAALFLMAAADEMDRMGESYGHLHMQDESDAWREEWPDIYSCVQSEWIKNLTFRPRCDLRPLGRPASGPPLTYNVGRQ